MSDRVGDVEMLVGQFDRFEFPQILVDP